MRKLILIAVILFNVLAMKGQSKNDYAATRKGTHIIGIQKYRSALGGVLRSETDKRYGSFIGTKYGYFLSDNLMVGGLFNLHSSFYHHEYTTGVFSRYYFAKRPVSPFLEGSFAYGVFDDQLDESASLRRSRGSVKVLPGISYEVNQYFGIEAFGGLHIGRDIDDWSIDVRDKDLYGNFILGARINFRIK